MPDVSIRITREGAAFARGVVSDELALEDWGIGGLPVRENRARVKAHG